MIETSGNSNLQAQADSWAEGEEQAEEEDQNNDPEYCDLVLDLVMQSLEEPFLSTVPPGSFTIGGLPEEMVHFSDGSSIGHARAAYHKSPAKAHGSSEDAPASTDNSAAPGADQGLHTSAAHHPGTGEDRNDGNDSHGFSSPGAPPIQGSLSGRGNRSRVQSARREGPGSTALSEPSNSADRHHQDGVAIDDLVDDLLDQL